MSGYWKSLQIGCCKGGKITLYMRMLLNTEENRTIETGAGIQIQDVYSGFK